MVIDCLSPCVCSLGYLLLSWLPYLLVHRRGWEPYILFMPPLCSFRVAPFSITVALCLLTLELMEWPHRGHTLCNIPASVVFHEWDSHRTHSTCVCALPPMHSSTHSLGGSSFFLLSCTWNLFASLLSQWKWYIRLRETRKSHLRTEHLLVPSSLNFHVTWSKHTVNDA